MSEQAVWKFPVRIADGRQEIKGPGLPRPAYFALQDGIPTVWAVVSPWERHELPRGIYIVGTGHPIPTGCTHVGSLQDGGFVWHLFMEGR